MSAEPKKYADASEYPLWAVENMHGLEILNAQPLWGIVGPSNATVPEALRTNVSTVALESLRLPGIMNDYSYLLSEPDPRAMMGIQGQNLPGVDFYAQALRNAFNTRRGTELSFGDYSGQTQLALYALWQNYSSKATDASNIVNLIWTDISANAVVGTKGWGLTSVAAAGSSGSNHDAVQDSTVPVTLYERRVRYHMLFAIPAFVVLAMFVGLVIFMLVLAVTKKTSFAKMHRLLDGTSAGRIMGLHLWPEDGSGLTTKQWIQEVGPRVAISTGSAVLIADSPAVVVGSKISHAALEKSVAEAHDVETEESGTGELNDDETRPETRLIGEDSTAANAPTESRRGG